MQQQKLFKLANATAIAGIVSSFIYLLLSAAWVLFTIKEIFFYQTPMGILILALPIAAAYGIVGAFAMRASIRLFKANNSSDISRISILLQNNLTFAILFTIGGAWFLPLLIVTAPTSIIYLILDILSSSLAKKVLASSSLSKTKI